MATPNPLDQFNIKATNWRNTIRQNTRRTYVVIALFFLIYIGIGLLVDLYVESMNYPNADLSHLFYALITFHLFPVFTLLFFVIALVSLLVSFFLHDQLMLLGTDYKLINPNTASNTQEVQLYNVVEEIKIAAGLRYMPKVYLINADYMNAFASGFSEKSAMVAITKGLIQKLNRDELQAVMAHEVSHIRHMDIKLTLTASLLANLTLMVLDMLFYQMIFSRPSNNNRSRNNLAFIIILLRYALPLINLVLLFYLSRTRELMADAGCVELTRDNRPLASALIKINDDYTNHQAAYSAALAQTPHENVRRQAYLFDPTQAGISGIGSITDIFSTHPSLAVRLAALGFTSRNPV